MIVKAFQSLLVIALVTMPAFYLKAQLYEISLDQKIDKSLIIVEGKVVDSKSYLNEKNIILTAHKIELSKLLKGNLEESYLTIITMGGELDGIQTTWTHLLSLKKGDKGLFFLKQASKIGIGDRTFPAKIFEVYSGVQGFLAYHQDGLNKPFASEVFHTYDNIETQLYQYVEHRTGQVLKIKGDKKTGIRYLFNNINIAPDLTYVEFDVHVNGLGGEYKLKESGLRMTYNTGFFGSFMATNNSIQLTPNEVANSPAYTLSAVDVSENEVEVKLSTTGNISLLNTITSEEKPYAHIRVNILDPTVPFDVNFDANEMQQLSKYYNPIIGQEATFDTVIVEVDFKKLAELLAPDIVDFFPRSLAGGVWDTLTITGSEFGEEKGNSRIQFKNAHKGLDGTWAAPLDGEYLFWSDTLIKVLVPSFGELGTSGNLTHNAYAGSGKFRIRKGFLPWQISNSQDELEVKFSAFNRPTSPSANPSSRGTRSALGNYNGVGGYFIYFTSEFKNYTGARAAFGRALTTWRCATQVHFQIRDSSQVAGQQNSCEVSFDDLPVGTETTLGVTSPELLSFCIDFADTTLYRSKMGRFKLKYNRGVVWHTDSLMPASIGQKTDMESVTVHELGHAHLLKHSNQTNDLMYWTNTNPPYRRELEPFDLEGGLYVTNLSIQPNALQDSNCVAPMNLFPVPDCVVITSTNSFPFQPNILVSIFPNPSKGKLSFSLNMTETQLLQMKVVNIVGQVIEEQKITAFPNITYDLDLQGLQSGIYFLNFESVHGGQIVERIVIQN